jgi:hypothetical protein
MVVTRDDRAPVTESGVLPNKRLLQSRVADRERYALVSGLAVQQNRETLDSTPDPLDGTV